MLRIFRRLWGPARQPSQSSGHSGAAAPDASDAPTAPAALLGSEPIPVPEVLEGNGGESDWNLWQDSVMTLESGFQQLAVIPRGHEKTQPLSSEELKAYTKPPAGEAT